MTASPQVCARKNKGINKGIVAKPAGKFKHELQESSGSSSNDCHFAILLICHAKSNRPWKLQG